MASNHCVLTPKVPNGESSKLFQALKNITNDREIAKKIWGFTQTDLFKSEFTDIETDENGEPTLEAISQILQLDKVLSKSEQDNKMAIKDGLMDSSGRPASFSLASAALSKADRFNEKAENRVAIVQQGEEGFETVIKDKTPMAIAQADRNKQRAELNTALITLLNRAGFDIGFVDDPSYQSVFNPLFAEQNAETLKQVIRVANGEAGLEAIPEEVSHLILAGLQGHPLKTRIDAAFTDPVVRRVLGSEYNKYRNEYRKGKTPLQERLRDEAEGKVLAAVLKGQPLKFTEEEILNIDQNEYTDEFRRLQKSSNQLSEESVRAFQSGRAKLTANEQRAMGAVLQRLLSRRLRDGNQLWIDLEGKGNNFRIARVNGQLFHDVFQVTQKYLPNGDLVDLHESYGDDVQCFLSEDGMQGFAIEPDGNLVSVFSLNPQKFAEKNGFLYAISDFVKEHGANHLDAYASENQDLSKIYAKVLGFQIASRMEFNPAYDETGVGKRHGNPDVVFMVDSKNAVEERHFGPNQYNQAVNYQLNQVKQKVPFFERVKNLFRRLFHNAMEMFNRITERDVDAAITNAQNALKPIADLMKSGEIEQLLDKDQIMAHEKMYDLSSQTEKMLEIVQEGEVMLSKKLHILQNTTTEEDTSKLRKTITGVRNDLENQRYALACYRIIDSIGKEIKGLMTEADSLHFVFNNTTNLNLISSEAGLVNRMGTAVQAYTPYLETLASIKDLVDRGQIVMDASWADRVTATANEYLGHIRTLQKDIRSMRFSVLKQLVMLYYGNMGEKPEGFVETEQNKWESVDMILSQANEDISWWDTNLFSAGDSRNPLINVIHNIVVTQQAKRNNKINKLCSQMQEADAKLKKAGYDSKFIYQYDAEGKPTGYYVAPIDMMRYERERKEFIESLDNEELDFYERQRKINTWENQHLEEVPVGKPLPDGTRRTEFMPKRSIYGVTNFQEGWSQAQKDYYDSVLEMKAEMDAYLPGAMQSLYTAPQVRKSVTQMFDKDGRGALKTLLGQWKQRFTIVDDNMEYEKNTVFGFDGKPIKQVPVYFVNKLQNRADLSTDGTHAIFNYIAMAVNYAEMGQLANAMRLMQQHVKSDYEVVQTDAGKPIIDRFKSLGRKYEREYTETGTGTNVVKAIDTYINRMFFNDTKEKLGNMKHPFNDDKVISKDSIFNIFMHLTSVGRMGLNVLSGITNATQGETQMMCEAAAGRFFGVKDLAWSKKEYGKLLLDYVGQFNSADRHDKMYMLINQFNSSEDFFRDMMDKDFNKGAYKRVLGRGNIYFLNTMGEHYLHTSGMLMILHHEKVKRASNPNKEVPLYDVIKPVHDENGWHLELDDDIEFVDKNRAFLQTDNLKGKQIIKKSDRDALFENLALYINKINADMHGGYSEAEKGNINRKAIGQAILQFRQWMFGMYNKLYARSYYDAVNKVMREGGYRSIGKFITGTIHDWKNMSLKLAIENNQLTYEEKQNARVALVQSALFVILCVMCKATAGWKDEDDRNTRLMAYSLKRLRMETGALVPWPPSFIENIFTLIQSPAAGVNTLQNVMGIFDLNNLFDEVGAGRYKGWNKALKALWTSTPLYNIQKLIDMKDYNYMFNIFK